MTRYALLIESSQLTGHYDLPGARADIELLRSWMMSPKGGAWRGHEIVSLSHPSIAKVKECLARAKKFDYAFVSFSGHGHHVVGNGFNETRVCLNDDEELAASALNPKNPRSTILIDACRGLTVLVPQLLLESYTEKTLSLNLSANRIKAREKFDQLVRSSEQGVIYLYSCSVDESAAEDENGRGGLFTLGLVRAAENWKPSVGRFFSIRNAYAAAADFTRSENPQQQPRWSPGARKRFFPFAVTF